VVLAGVVLRAVAEQQPGLVGIVEAGHGAADRRPCGSGRPGADQPGGEGQRLAVAVALSSAPGLLLADEPTSQLDRPNRDRVVQTLRLADQLGAETVTLSGQSVSEELLTYARTRNVSKMVIGKPRRPRWRPSPGQSRAAR
jgi:nucleotide-binding universal stress UspA family protein